MPLADITINCPPMAVRHYSQGKKLTDNLHCPDCKIIWGTVNIPFSFVFPATLVREKSLINWMVDPCMAFGTATVSALKSWYVVILNVPEEPCNLHIGTDGVYMVAEEVVATGTVELATGVVGKATVTLAATKAYWQEPGLWLVDAMVCTGKVDFQDT